ncbi:NUDIX domain-containing protein [Streptomyces sp. NPDC051582]|uniref:NUDIX domain-containing protein n=1 Tax=Streptomyces sp. NPDC051582 TaxID=3155167 RepID=UPI003447911D
MVLLALRPDGRVALVRRTRCPDQGRLTLVGGRLQPAEWVAEAACREASQTLGIQVGVQDLELSGLLHYRSEGGAGRLCVVFATQRWCGEPRTTPALEYGEVVWVDPGGPPADCRPLTHAALNQYVGGTLYAAVAMPGAGTVTREDGAAGSSSGYGSGYGPRPVAAGPGHGSTSTAAFRDARGTK